ncbi:hypothetical protein CDV31_006753 [Fusarium ambrosium]|uniref:Uncharacterized protein n=1 Tax=Fusarium ambrosium TaxID=131363 RepID=A0A428UB59_9HYPO|nr:hypothetical protein CDV31_006753 [Fusarium ambrosium]
MSIRLHALKHSQRVAITAARLGNIRRFLSTKLNAILESVQAAGTPSKLIQLRHIGQNAQRWFVLAAPVKLLGLLEKATPAIALSKADDDEISQSGIDELLDDDDEIWEDFSDDEPLEDILDDESAGHLLMRFEEKHALDDSVDDSN